MLVVLLIDIALVEAEGGKTVRICVKRRGYE